MFFKALPQRTGTNIPLRVPTLNPSIISSVLRVSPSKYFSKSVSSHSAAFSTNASRHFRTSSPNSLGISFSSCSVPNSLVFEIALFDTKSTNPEKSPADPMGNWIGTGFAPNFSRIASTVAKKSAPFLSILLTKAILGTLYLSACLQTVSDWGSTPATASNTATAPSRTLRLLSTSTVKSTCPGVSMIFILWSFHWAAVAAAVIVIPLSCSWTIQSMVAAPSWTSPIL